MLCCNLTVETECHLQFHFQNLLGQALSIDVQYVLYQQLLLEYSRMFLALCTVLFAFSKTPPSAIWCFNFSTANGTQKSYSSSSSNITQKCSLSCSATKNKIYWSHQIIPTSNTQYTCIIPIDPIVPTYSPDRSDSW